MSQLLLFAAEETVPPATLTVSSWPLAFQLKRPDIERVASAAMVSVFVGGVPPSFPYVKTPFVRVTSVPEPR